jgi:conjugative relaxase-like TrwC/TraI family protein
MLSIGKLALGQQRYYEQSVAQGQDDYYSGRGEAPGDWTGAGAGELGLAGTVNAGQFNALLEGRDPRVADLRLRASNSEPSIAAFDLTFSAPKSVSVLFAVAPTEVSAALVECHEAAVRSALGYLEETAVFVRRGKGGVRFEHAGGLIAAAYRHRMSRALDPQLHTHVVAANLARGDDGRYTALHHPSLYRAARTAGYLYQSELRSLVRDRLGLEWGAVHKGAAELIELPNDVLRVFSQRRAQVEQAVAVKEAELGRPSTRAERETWGAIATRDRKHYGIDTHTWQEEITARAGEHGLDRGLVDEITDRGRERLERGELAHDGVLEIDGARVGEWEFGDVLAGPAGLTALANTFDEAAVLREFAAAASQGSRVGVLRGQAVRFAGREDVLATDRGMLTTANLVAVERGLVGSAAGRVGEGAAQLPSRTVERALTRGARSLNDGQAAAVRAVAASGNGVDVIEALAGTGKTYTAGALRELYESAGYAVLGIAPTGRAVRELSEQAGIVSRTLDSELLSIDAGWGLAERCVVIFDEAGMASTRLSARLFEHAAEVGAKVIVIGDPGQLPSVSAGGWMRAVGERVGTVRLTEVMRQRDRGERLALAALHDGIPQRWIEWAAAHGRIEVLKDDRDALVRAVGEWASGVETHGVEGVVMIARENETRRALNELARECQRDNGRLGEEHVYGPVTVAVGDRVICRRNDRDVDVDNGMRGTVRHVDGDRVVIETDAHLTRELPAGYVAEHLEHAYALTGHGMQGATVEQAVVLAAPHDLTQGWSYTALSRARGETRLLITGREPAAREREDIAPAARSTSHEASEVFERVAHRMLERDDEDLAIDQLPPAGRADDPDLNRAPVGEPLQEHVAERAEPETGEASPRPLAELRERVEQLQAQLAALPGKQLWEFDELQQKTIELTESRERLRNSLAGLPEPKTKLFGRVEDPHFADRVRLRLVLDATEGSIERTLTERDKVAGELGNPDAIRTESDGLRNALQQARREHNQALETLVERELAGRPEWTREALGERPDGAWRGRQWDETAAKLARYRITYDITDTQDPLGPEPPAGEQRREYQQAQRSRERSIEREMPGRDIDL